MLPESNLSKHDFPVNLAPTILVVEDEELIRTFVKECLFDCGYHTVEASNVEEAKQILLDRDVDVVFSDINMPGSETGFALEKWIRSHFPRIKVLLTSGFPHPASATRDLLEPLIPKPYRGMNVVKRIQTLLSVK